MSDDTSPPRVTGIGGIFFKADDPKSLSAWYGKHLGLAVQDGWDGALFHWQRNDRPGEAACSVWNPFSADTKYFEPSRKPFMINFRVDDLDAVLDALRSEGVTVLDRREDGPQGRFGYVLDPEGLLLELWQPADNGTGADAPAAGEDAA